MYGLWAGSSRAMSACDASATSNPANNLDVWLTGVPGLAPKVLFYVADNLGDFESVRFKSSGGP